MHEVVSPPGQVNVHLEKSLFIAKNSGTRTEPEPERKPGRTAVILVNPEPHLNRKRIFS